MDIKAVRQLINQVLDESQILENEPMKNHTSFKVGGCAGFVVQPNSIEELTRLVKTLGDTPYFVMGNGSNLLVSDSGYEGVVIKVCGGLSRITVDGNTITAESGNLLSRIANTAYNCGLGGFEFAAGIPGTLGGAVIMNAGAYGGEIKDVVVWTQFIDENGVLQEVTDHNFSYRRSIFTGEKIIVVKSKIELFPKDKTEIKQLMNELSQKRCDKQPLNYPSAGSTFKRPEGYFAGKLIEDAGLKGYKIGGAQISEKHSGFIINTGDATFSDIMNLIEYTRQRVYEQFGIELEPEVKILGE